MTEKEILSILKADDNSELQAIFNRALKTKISHCGNKVYFRGIIEFSNICDKNCFYCGIRHDNGEVSRYRLSQKEILNEAIWTWKAGYGSLVIQGGELESLNNTQFIEETLHKIKEATHNELGITLSLGEQTPEVYKRWFDAGAHRYLLRIETSNAEFYKTLHPASHSFEKRLSCLYALKEAGYQVGTGVLIGLPHQTPEMLAQDILFYKKFDVDMVGMGPFLPHSQTPMGKSLPEFDPLRQLQLGLKMIAATRLTLPDINIAATTALQALSPSGREQGILAGANVIMPNVTDTQYRRGYQLYQNKPNLDENATATRSALEKSIATTGAKIGYNEWGDSPHFFNRQNASK